MAAEALEQSMLESKDKDQLLAIAQALGIKTTARAAKATLIAKILETTGVGQSSSSNDAEPEAPAAQQPAVAAESADRANAPARGGNRDDSADDSSGQDNDQDNVQDNDSDDDDSDDDNAEGQGEGDGESRNARRRRRRRNKNRAGEGAPASGEQPAGRQPETAQEPRERNDRPERNDRSERNDRGPRPERNERSEGSEFSLEPVQVAGYLDLRDEGYGFLRVNGYLPSRDDAYIPVKLTRQYGLRKGDHVTGLSRPAGRNEKNPALLEIHTINGNDPELAKGRRKFEDLTALFPDKKLVLSTANDPHNMTVRIIDLVSPIGKGQRGIIVSPPKAGKTTVMKEIATAIERHNPEVKLIVLLIDERPEEVTDLQRSV